jgi:hypothetical protein
MAIGGVAFVDEFFLTVLVPAALAVGDYDVIVVNPNGSVGILGAGYRVTAQPPPLIDSVAPGSIPNQIQTVSVYGKNFSSPTAKLICKSPAGAKSTHPVTVTNATESTVTLSVDGGQVVQNSSCLVHIENNDGSYAQYSTLAVTNPAENITDSIAEQSLVHPRRAPATVIASSTRTSRFIYALGGDSGDLSQAIGSIETASLDDFGVLGKWRVLDVPLPAKTTLAGAVAIGQFIYLVGGHRNDQVANNVLRAQVLGRNKVPIINSVDIEFSDEGMTPGLWYYRVSAIMKNDDPDNPGGESLPSDPRPIIIPEDLPKALVLTLSWGDVPNVAGYRIYRTASPEQPAGTELLIGSVDEDTTSFEDDGLEAGSISTRKPGDLGVWMSMPSMNNAREAQGLAVATDPNDEDTVYIYAVAGQDVNGKRDDYEFLTIKLKSSGTHEVEDWKAGNNDLPVARSHGAAFMVDETATNQLSSGNRWVILGGGLSPSGTPGGHFFSGRVQAGGELSAWKQATKGGTPKRAGYGFAAASSQLFMFGGVQAQPSDNSISALICGPGSNKCNEEGTIANFNSTAASMVVPRFLPGSAVGNGRIYLIGGKSLTGVEKSVESVLW